MAFLGHELPHTWSGLLGWGSTSSDSGCPDTERIAEAVLVRSRLKKAIVTSGQVWWPVAVFRSLLDGRHSVQKANITEQTISTLEGGSCGERVVQCRKELY